MAKFEFPYHRVETDYPESGIQVEFGNNYVFNSKPDAPDMRTFTLSFPTMLYYLDSQGQIDKSHKPEMNMAALEDFYQQHRTWKSFTYPHPVYGDVTCRFKEPLRVPKPRKGGSGAVESFSIKLVESPT